ncbi:ANTAR domain-containing protein [Streptomyces sp. NPDC001816]|uniref:ANTAR domain-containing protein n=1 Tax=Streptomyces sp. NPDC001816 TaxID=3364612 RepID=UPI0036AB04F6
MPDPCHDKPFTALLVRTEPAGSRVTVTVSGEFRLDDSEDLRRALRTALATSAEGVSLDLSGLSFTDCSALNILLSLRGQAVAAGKTVTVTAASPAAEHLLTVTDTYALFSATRAGSTASAGQPSRHFDDDDGLLRTEVVQLRRALRTRPDIDLARGILMASFGLNPDEAWQVLVTASQNTNTKLHHLARDVVMTTEQGVPLPDPVQRRLTAAIACARRTGPHPQASSRTRSGLLSPRP